MVLLTHNRHERQRHKAHFQGSCISEILKKPPLLKDSVGLMLEFIAISESLIMRNDGCYKFAYAG